MKKKNREVQRKGQSGRQETRKVERLGKLHSKRLRTGLVVALSCLLIFSISFLLWNSSATSPQGGQQTDIQTPKAVILDGLYSTSPNPSLEQSLTSFLSTAGFRVDVFRGENVTIPLLTNAGGYKVLILRLHSAIHEDGFLYLFSGEPYSPSKYVAEQTLWGSVKRGRTFDNEEYFAINAVLLGGNKPDSLKGSMIILMGCNGTGDSYSVQRLFDKGVEAYVAWTGFVDLSHSDVATLALIRALYAERLGLKEAVQKAMGEVGPDPLYKSVLEYRTREG